jgi:hypothetical protein
MVVGCAPRQPINQNELPARITPKMDTDGSKSQILYIPDPGKYQDPKYQHL